MTAEFLALLDREISGSIGNKGDTLNYILKQMLNGSQLPYKVYTALLTQSGVEAPTAVVLQNTLGNVNYIAESESIYTIESNNLFLENKTILFFGTGNTSPNPRLTWTSIDALTIECSSSDELNNTSIEIRVYE
jgi:hypothetical protein